MSKQIEINGNAMVPLKEAAKKIAYSRDYLAKLAREQKIVATQIGRQWFVDMDSLNIFLAGTALEQEVRSRHLREERRRELIAKKDLETLAGYVTNAQSLSNGKSFLIATLVLFIGLFTGLVINNTKDLVASFDNRYFKSSSIAQVINNKAVVTPEDQDNKVFFSNEMEYPLFVDEAEVRDMESNKDGILLLTEKGDLNDLNQVRNLFSDNVDIEIFPDGKSGVVRYESGEGEVNDFPFVTIPSNGSADDVPIKPST